MGQKGTTRGRQWVIAGELTSRRKGSMQQAAWQQAIASAFTHEAEETSGPPRQCESTKAVEGKRHGANQRTITHAFAQRTVMGMQRVREAAGGEQQAAIASCSGERETGKRV